MDDGITVSTSEQHRAARAASHFALVSRGKTTTDVEELKTVPVSNTDGDIDFSASRLETVNNKLSKNKGLGLDHIGLNLMCAGGSAVAVQQSKLGKRAVREDTWPCQIKGGRMVTLFKDKGDPRDLDNSRGLIICSHFKKVFTSVLLPS